MGDHRFFLKIEFEMHDVKEECTFNMLNYSPSTILGSIDQNVEDKLNSLFQKAIEGFFEEEEKARAEHNKKAIEFAERKELARLKAIYEKEG